METDSGSVPRENAIQRGAGETVSRFQTVPESVRIHSLRVDPPQASIKVDMEGVAREGAADRELLSLLSESFGIERSRAKAIFSSKKRFKVLLFTGLIKESILAVLAKLTGEEYFET